MNHFTITRSLDASVDRVWRIIGDPGTSPGRGVDVRVERPGAADGIGLVRVVKVGLATAHEEITDRRPGPRHPLSHDQRSSGPRLHEQRGSSRQSPSGGTVRLLGRSVPPAGPRHRLGRLARVETHPQPGARRDRAELGGLTSEREVAIRRVTVPTAGGRHARHRSRPRRDEDPRRRRHAGRGGRPAPRAAHADGLAGQAPGGGRRGDRDAPCGRRRRRDRARDPGHDRPGERPRLRRPRTSRSPTSTLRDRIQRPLRPPGRARQRRERGRDRRMEGRRGARRDRHA